MKTLVRVTMALVAVFAFTLSFQSLTTLGEFAGYGSLSWMYPLCVDLGTVSSCAAWIATKSRQAFHMTWSLLGVSVIQNACVHWLVATGRTPEWWLITAVACVPPLVLGLTTHLSVSLGAATAAPEVDADGPVDAVRHKETPELPRESQGSDPDLIPPSGGISTDPDPVAELIEQGVGRRRLAQVAGVSEHKARKMLEERR